jgi:hypothetical protein
MAQDNACTHIRFSRVFGLLDEQYHVNELTEKIYLERVPEWRKVLCDANLPANFDAAAEIASDEDTATTYAGYKKFLELELDTNTTLSKSAKKQKCAETGKKMMGRGKVSTKARFILSQKMCKLT